MPKGNILKYLMFYHKSCCLRGQQVVVDDDETAANSKVNEKNFILRENRWVSSVCKNSWLRERTLKQNWKTNLSEAFSYPKKSQNIF